VVTKAPDGMELRNSVLRTQYLLLLRTIPTIKSDQFPPRDLGLGNIFML
jgi:hypothetical protein